MTTALSRIISTLLWQSRLVTPPPTGKPAAVHLPPKDSAYDVAWTAHGSPVIKSAA